jgi:hypothetical protein
MDLSAFGPPAIPSVAPRPFAWPSVAWPERHLSRANKTYNETGFERLRLLLVCHGLPLSLRWRGSGYSITGPFEGEGPGIRPEPRFS